MNIQQPNEIQTTIKSIWENVLGIAVDDEEANFFIYGGNSIQAMEIMHQLNEKFNLELSIADFFDTLTVSKLSELVVSQKH